MKKLLVLLSIAGTVLTAPCLQAQHVHLNAGIVDVNNNNQPNTGEPLALVNFPSSGLLVHMVWQPSGEYGGFYSLDQRPRAQYPNDYFTFTALSSGLIDVAGEDHAATGSFIRMLITSVSGPEGGIFGFWEGSLYGFNNGLAWSKNHEDPYWEAAANQSFTPFSFILSEGIEGDPLEDPQGHIHNRGWTATVPGTYTVGFQLIDSSNIHAPSQPYYITFVAGSPIPEPQTVTMLIGGALVGGFCWHRSRRKASRS